MKRLKQKLDLLVKSYSIIPLITCFLVNVLVYWGSMALMHGKPHYDFTNAFDRAVPFLPWTVSIYFICYVFWVINYIMIGHLGKEELYRFVTADLLSRFVCLFFFLVLPTTNVRPELTGNSIWNDAMRWLWKADEAADLFPSIHCLVSWYCYIAIRGKKQIPKWYRVFSCVFALMVCVSTQTTKQHYIIDMIGGIALAEGTMYLTHHTEFYRYVERFFTRINCKLHLDK